MDTSGNPLRSQLKASRTHDVTQAGALLVSIPIEQLDRLHRGTFFRYGKLAITCLGFLHWVSGLTGTRYPNISTKASGSYLLSGVFRLDRGGMPGTRLR